MRSWKTALGLLLAVVIIAAGYAIDVLRQGFSARETPSVMEKLAATAARYLAVPSSYRRLRNPYPVSPEAIRAGMEHFADHCSTCHSNDGSGETFFGKGLYPKPPDMRTAETQTKSDGELYFTIENGVRLSGMPAFGGHPGTHDVETWHLVAFIRHLPKLTSAELTQMEALNPKTEADRQEEKEEEDFLEGRTEPGNVEDQQHHH